MQSQPREGLRGRVSASLEAFRPSRNSACMARTTASASRSDESSVKSAGTRRRRSLVRTTSLAQEVPDSGGRHGLRDLSRSRATLFGQRSFTTQTQEAIASNSASSSSKRPLVPEHSKTSGWLRSASITRPTRAEGSAARTLAGSASIWTKSPWSAVANLAPTVVLPEPICPI